MKKIIIDRRIMHGEPVIEGTRMPVSIILGALADGMTMEEIMKQYEVTKEDIQAVLRYAADLVIEDKVIPLKKTS